MTAESPIDIDSRARDIAPTPRFRTATSDEATRVVEAISWFDRARIRNRRLQAPAFRSEVDNDATLQDLQGAAEQASKSVYRPTMDSRGWHMKTVQEDLAETAHDGGKAMGDGKFSYQSPTTRLKQMQGLTPPNFGATSTIGKLFGLIQHNPQAANKLVASHPIAAGVFSVEVGQTGKSTRVIDLAEPVNSVSSEEMTSMDEFSRSLFQTKQMTPQQILGLYDRLQAGQRVNIKAGPQTASWMNGIMSDVGETLRADASRIGALNLVATICKLGTIVAAALGFVTMAAMTQNAYSHITPPTGQEMQQALPQNGPYHLQNTGTTTAPGASFGASGGTPSTSVATPGANLGMGTVYNGFGNIGGAMNTNPPPMVDFSSVLPTNPQNLSSLYQPNRTSASEAARRVLIAQALPAQSAPASTGPDLNQLLESIPSWNSIVGDLDKIASQGEGPMTYRSLMDYITQRAHEVSPILPLLNQSGEATPSTEIGGERTAQVIDKALDLMNIVSPKKIGDAAMNQTGPNAQGDSTLDSDTPALKQLNDQDQDAATSSLASGDDRHEYESWLGALGSVGVLPQQAAPFISAMNGFASQASCSLDQVMTVATAILRRADGDTARAEKIVGTLAHYESQFPGAGVFSVAQMAASGQPFQQPLMALRLGLVKNVMTGTDDTKPLADAIYGIVNPSSQLGSFMDGVLLQNQRMKQQLADLGIDIARVKAVWQKQRDAYLAGVYRNFQTLLPGFVKMPAFQFAMRMLQSVASACAVASTIKGGVGIGKTPGLLSPLMPGQHTASAKPRFRTAQYNPLAATGNDTPSNPLAGGQAQNPQTQQIGANLSQNNQQATQAQQGGMPPNVNTQEAQQEQAWVTWLSQTCAGARQAIANFDNQFKLVVQTLSVGQDPSQGGLGAAPFLSAGAAGSQGAALEKIGLDAYNKLQVAYQAISGQIAQMTSNPQITANVKSLLQNTLIQFEQTMIDVRSKTLAAQQFSIAAPILQRIRQVEPMMQLKKRQIARAKNNGLSMGPGVADFIRLSLYCAQLYEQAMAAYGQIAQKVTDETIRNWIQTQYYMAANMADQYKGDAQEAMTNMKQNKWGESATNGIAALNMGRASAADARATRFSSEASEIREADKEIEDYYNDLYRDTDAPGYGTLLEHVEDHEDDLSTEVEPDSCRFARKHKRDASNFGRNH